MIKWLKNRVQALKAQMARHIVIKETTRQLEIAQAHELATTPGEQWGLVREKYAAQLDAVRAGKMDIVDRRSFQWPYMPLSVQQIKQPVIKQIPWSVRQFSRTPTVRRAINMIRNSVVSLEWGIQPIGGSEPDPDQQERINIAKYAFLHPNDIDSLQTFFERGIDELCVNGGMSVELQLTPYPQRPFKMWQVDSSTIRMYPDWKESMRDQPRYAQMTGLRGERGIIVFYDDELMYVPDNPACDSPFGYSKVEVGFKHISALIGVQDMSGRAGTDQIHKTWLWWNSAQMATNMDVVRRHIEMNVEGMSRLSLLAGMQKPEVVEVTPVSIEDLLLEWQEMCMRQIGNAFDLSSMALNLEKDINRSTGEVLSDADFRSAVFPMATRIENSFTQKVLHELLGWKDLEFKFLNMDDPDPATKLQMLQQKYQMNATTANEIRVATGQPKLKTPLADLTQIELTILFTQMSAQMNADIQNSNADKAATRQLGVQKQSMQQQMDFQNQQGQQNMGDGSSFGDSGNGQDGAQAAASTGKSKAPKAPKALTPPPPPAPPMTVPPLPKVPKAPPAPKPPSMQTLPKGPMRGSIYSADQVSQMTPDQIDDARQKGQLPKSKKQLKQNMQEQDQFILSKLDDQLKEYFDQMDDDEDADILPQDPTPEQSKRQQKMYRLHKHVLAPVEKQVFIAKDKSNQMYKDRRNPNRDVQEDKPKRRGKVKARRKK